VAAALMAGAEQNVAEQMARALRGKKSSHSALKSELYQEQVIMPFIA